MLAPGGRVYLEVFGRDLDKMIIRPYINILLLKSVHIVGYHGDVRLQGAQGVGRVVRKGVDISLKHAGGGSHRVDLAIQGGADAWVYGG